MGSTDRFSIPGRRKRFFFPERWHLLTGPPSLLFRKCRRFIHWEYRGRELKMITPP